MTRRQVYLVFTVTRRDQGVYLEVGPPLLKTTVSEVKDRIYYHLFECHARYGVEEIQDRAFRLNGLTEVKIADTVTFSGQYAFRNNGDLVLVEIGEGVTIEGDFTFAGNFEKVYENHNKSAGVYKRDDENSDWYKEE